MKDHEPQKDGTQGTPPQKSKAGGGQERARKHAEGHPAAHPNALRDERLTHPANAEPLAELLSQLQRSHGNAYVQRFVSEAGESEARGRAQELDAGTRSLMESAFGEDFGEIRVHTGGEAEGMNEDLGARAVTRGRDIYFGRGEYDPSTREGRELIAHELTHVAQQRRREKGREVSTRESIENEADEIKRLATEGRPVEVRQAADSSSAYLQRGQGQPQQGQPQQGQPQQGQPQQGQPQQGQPSGQGGRPSWNQLIPGPGQAPAQTQPQPSGQAFELNVTPQIISAVEQLLFSQRFEDQQIEIYLSRPRETPAVIVNNLFRFFHAAGRQMLSQVPPNVDRDYFLYTFGAYIWQSLRERFMQHIAQRRQTDPAFRRKLERAERRHRQPDVPPDGRVV